MRNKVTNTILEEDNNKKEDYNVKYIPSIIINGRYFYGSKTVANLYEAICASLIYKPDSCQKFGSFKLKETESHIVLIIIISCILVSLLIFIVCRYRMNKNISDNLESSNIGHKISTVVTSYMSLKDNPRGI